MTINADLRVGALEESITVTGDAPVVDVQSTQRTHVLNRDMLDALPTARNYSGLAALMPGVKMSNTDVGGNQQMEQIYMRVHGSRQTDTTVQVDGMQLNSLMSDGQVQAYFSDAANAEVTYQTSGVGAEVSGGGLRINMIPKEGGNRISGSVVRRRHAPELAGRQRHRGTARPRRRSAATRVDHIVGLQLRDRRSDPAGQAVVLHDRPPHRHQRSRRATTSTGTASQGIEDQWIYNILGRLTYQATQQDQDHGVLRPLPEVQGPRDGRVHRSRHGGAAP